MKRRLLAVLVTALGLTLCATAPADARYIRTNPTASGQTNALLEVRDHSTASRDGWSVRWKIKLTCPRGSSYTGYAIVAQRNPASIPELFGDDAGIRARIDLAGTCTGRQQALRLTLPVQDTSFFDPALGTTRTVHEPISPSTATNHAVQIYDAGSQGTFFTQYCAAPACADYTGPNIPLLARGPAPSLPRGRPSTASPSSTSAFRDRVLAKAEIQKVWAARVRPDGTTTPPPRRTTN